MPREIGGKMFQITAPWGQWKRGTMDEILAWLKMWMDIIPDKSGFKDSSFIIYRVGK
jgi:hypothetical protein